jgi:hypothetical protein
MAVLAGLNPEQLVCYFTTGADFIHVEQASPAWAGGSTVTLVFGSIASPTATYTATIVGADATFKTDKATADSRPAGEWVCLKYVNGTDDQILAIGRTVRRG